MAGYFNAQQLKLASDAFYEAEMLTSRHFKEAPKEWKLRYDVKTLAQVAEEEITEGAFAHLCRYEGNGGYFYRICLQDSLILQAVMRSRSFIKLPPLLLYIAAHELVHVIRFANGIVEFDAPMEKREEEEERVHAITRHLLQQNMNHELRLVVDCFSNRYQIC